MLDLIMLGWPWFVGAGALGALTGYVTSAREKGTAVVSGWVFFALLLALATGAAASAGGVIEGRMAVTFDIGLAVSAAYVFGLPLGRAFKLLGAQREEAPRAVSAAKPVAAEPIAAEPIAARPIAAKPAAVESTMPVATPVLASVAAIEEAPAHIEAAPVLEDVVVAAKALDAKAVEMRVRDKAAKKPAGERPPTLAAPHGAADDLTRIKGLGPRSAEKLNALGIFHYDQIAGWSRDNAKWIAVEMGVASRVERDQWIAQARKLAGVSEESAASAA